MSQHVREIPDNFLAKWQQTANVMAHIFEVPAGLIMRVLPEQIEVLVASEGEANPYEAEEKAPLNTGLYCETVMASRALLQVPDALEDPAWRHNPDVALHMVSYLGVPLLWPDQQVFGTICVLDSKKRQYPAKYIDLLWEIKKAIEADFALIEQQKQLQASNDELRGALRSLTLMQDELLRSEKNAALGALVAGITHELNTPIGNSLLVASTLQADTEGFAREMAAGITRSRMTQYVDTVRQGTEILMRTLGSAAELVGSFKQVAVDQSSVNRRVFNLRDTVGEILMTLGPTIHHSGCRVENEIPDGIAMDSYPGPLGQVLSNLINNALLHAYSGREQGAVRIAAALLDGDRVRLTVSDDGNGIPQANLARIFDPFFTTKLGHGGSGLGLHIAHNLMTTALRGSIEVASAPGKGACFTLLLPRVAAG